MSSILSCHKINPAYISKQCRLLTSKSFAHRPTRVTDPVNGLHLVLIPKHDSSITEENQNHKIQDPLSQDVSFVTFDSRVSFDLSASFVSSVSFTLPGSFVSFERTFMHMPRSNRLAVLTLFAAFFSANALTATAQDAWWKYNLKPVRYNPDCPGAGNSGNTNYNKMQIPGVTQRVKEDTGIYDNQGNLLGEAKEGKIGYYDNRRQGGINSGAITKVRINGVSRDVIYAHAALTVGGGSQSGYIRLNKLTPRSTIEDKQNEIADKIADLLPSQNNHSYKKMRVVNKTLPNFAEEYYVTPNRDPSKTAGKAKFYWVRDGVLDGLINLPETGSQRYGVSWDQAPVGSPFWMDEDVDEYVIEVFAPNSSKVSKNASFRMRYGYFKTNANKKRYCWTNRECLNNY